MQKKMQIFGIIEKNNLDFIVLSKYILPEKYQKSICIFLQQFRFIVLSKYILLEKYQKSGMLKAKIRVVEEIPTVGFYANNNLDFVIFLHNTNNRKNIKKSSFCFFLILNIIFKYFTLFWILLLYSTFREAGKRSLVIL